MDYQRTETSGDWEQVRRIRQPLAWVLLGAAAVRILTGVYAVLGLPGSLLPEIGGITLDFQFRATAELSVFAGLPETVLPVIAVVIVTLAGGATARARDVTTFAGLLLGVSLGFGAICWLSELAGDARSSWGVVTDLAALAIPAAGLVFVLAMLVSRGMPRTRLVAKSGSDLQGGS